MEKTDARKLGKEVLQELRNQIIRLRLKGKQNNEVAEIVGVSVPHASTVWQNYKRGGRKAVVIGKRGRRTGEQRVLTSDQEKQIQRFLIDKTPDQLKLPFGLWTREAVRELIKYQYDLEMPVRTVGEYLKRWGFTPRKPIKRAYEQNPVKVNLWLQQEYPEIAVRAKKEKAEIYWGDETGLQVDGYRVRGFAPRGTKPVLRLNAKKSGISMISAINNEGQMRFMFYRKGMTSQLLIKFMGRLIKDTERKVFLIVDNLKAHHSKAVTEWVKWHEEKIELFYLPAYSPELNPDEYLNNDLKAKVHSGVPARSEKDLHKKSLSQMRRIAKKPNHVQNYFKHHKVSYAA
jgi:transposase